MESDEIFRVILPDQSSEYIPKIIFWVQRKR